MLDRSRQEGCEKELTDFIINGMLRPFNNFLPKSNLCLLNILFTNMNISMGYFSIYLSLYTREYIKIKATEDESVRSSRPQDVAPQLRQ